MGLKLNQKAVFKHGIVTLVNFCEEPNTGLCRLDYNNFQITIPCEFAEKIFEGAPVPAIAIEDFCDAYERNNQ